MDDAALFTTRRILVYVEDLEAATDYYSNVLGFVGVGGVPGVNREFSTSGPPLVLHEGGHAAREPRGRVGFVPSFQVADGIFGLIETYRERGVSIVHEVQEVSHGWIAFIADLEGNVIQIHQAKDS